MNTIFIHDLRIETKVGVYAWERQLPQTIRVDLDIALPSSRPFETGELADAIDYAAVVSRIRGWARGVNRPTGGGDVALEVGRRSSSQAG